MSRSWEGDGPCKDCGGANIRWTAPYEIWDSVTGAAPGVSTGGILCPQCFVRRAWDKGLTDVNWSLVPIPKGFSVKVPLRGRVVPTYHYFEGVPRELLRQWYATFIGTDGRWKTWPEESADLTETSPGRDRVSVNPVRRFDLLSLAALLVVVIHGRIFRSGRVVVLRHGGSPPMWRPPARPPR
jgi:hypothetical protein